MVQIFNFWYTNGTQNSLFTCLILHNPLFYGQKNDGTLNRSVFRGFWLNTPTLIRSECKKVGHNILFIMTILL